MAKRDKGVVIDQNEDDRDESLSLKMLILLNWAFAVFSFVGLVLLIVLQLGVSLFISSSENAQIAPPEIIALGFIYIIPALITACLGIEGFQRGSERILNVHLVFNFTFSILTVVGCSLLIVTFQGSGLNDVLDGFIGKFVDHFDDLSQTEAQAWVDVQNSFSCCASNAESLFEIGRAVQMTGALCDEFNGDSSFLTFFGENEDNLTSFLAEIGDFEVPFCEEKLLDLFESLVPLFIALLVLNVLSQLSQVILYLQWRTSGQQDGTRRVSYEEEEEEQLFEINIRPTSKRPSSREDDLLATGSIIKTKSLAPELKDIYSKNWKMSRKNKAKESSDDILQQHLEEFEEEEKNASLKQLDVVKADLPRNQPRRVSLVRFPGKQDDELMAEINRKETSETLGRVQYETLNTYLVSEDDDESPPPLLEEDQNEDMSFL